MHRSEVLSLASVVFLLATTVVLVRASSPLLRATAVLTASVTVIQLLVVVNGRRPNHDIAHGYYLVALLSTTMILGRAATSRRSRNRWLLAGTSFALFIALFPASGTPTPILPTWLFSLVALGLFVAALLLWDMMLRREGLLGAPTAEAWPALISLAIGIQGALWWLGLMQASQLIDAEGVRAGSLLNKLVLTFGDAVLMVVSLRVTRPRIA